jgi:co-chaperonin GroES (HSP10)
LEFTLMQLRPLYNRLIVQSLDGDVQRPGAIAIPERSL